MIKTSAMLQDELRAYANPKTKLARMVREGVCFPIARGLYETDRNVPGYLLAGSLYGPSYLSFDYALARHGLIPEAVYVFTNATFEKLKRKRYETPFGTFTYRDVPSAAFPWGLEILREGDYAYRMATPEKALCDKLYTLPPVTNLEEMEALLFEDLRVDEDALSGLNPDHIAFLSERYASTNVRKLTSFLRRNHHGQRV